MTSYSNFYIGADDQKKLSDLLVPISSNVYLNIALKFSDEAKTWNKNTMAGLTWFNIIVAKTNDPHNTSKSIIKSNNILMNTSKSTGIGCVLGLKWHLIKDKQTFWDTLKVFVGASKPNYLRFLNIDRMIITNMETEPISDWTNYKYYLNKITFRVEDIADVTDIIYKDINTAIS